MSGAVAPNRVARETWLKTGLRVLADEGDGALTVERLCTALGRTRGSFYHHFTGTDGFAEALLEHWRETNTEIIIRKVNAIEDPWKRRAELDRLAGGLDSSLERAMRRWAASDDRARTALRAVDERRMAYLAAIIQEVADADEAEAAELARIEYAAFVGLQQLSPDLDEAARERLFQKITALVTPRRGCR